MNLYNKLKKPIVIFLMGPTALGKTQLAILLRQYLPIELISVDSASIYQGMDIGTSKPHTADLLNHPHRLLNIKDPIETYSASEFQKDVILEINHIIQSGRIPCLVGGTMFYYKILLDGLSPLPPSNMKLREYLSQKKHSQGTLHKKLKLIDPVSANRIHKNDFQRLLRALEVFYLSGKNLTTLIKEKKYEFPYTALQFAIIPPNKAWLHQKIETRIKKMLILGLQEEVELLFHRGDLHIDLPSIRCIGYRQMWEYLEYKISYQDMFNKIVYATKMLAKHQLTWLKKWKNVNILTYSSIYNVLIEKILNVFSKYNNKIL